MKSASSLGLVMLVCWIQSGPATSSSTQQDEKPALKMEPVAETQLLMQGINLPNFQGIEKLLKDKPTEAEAWKFMRGQALLIAENGNLLMLRPPRNAGQDVWLQKAAALRNTATKLAGVISEADYTRSRAGLIDLASACNDCHASFRVTTRVWPFSQEPEPVRPRSAPTAPPAAKSPGAMLLNPPRPDVRPQTETMPRK
jgi:hypothetical protein